MACTGTRCNGEGDTSEHTRETDAGRGAAQAEGGRKQAFPRRQTAQTS